VAELWRSSGRSGCGCALCERAVQAVYAASPMFLHAPQPIPSVRGGQAGLVGRADGGRGTLDVACGRREQKKVLSITEAPTRKYMRNKGKGQCC